MSRKTVKNVKLKKISAYIKQPFKMGVVNCVYVRAELPSRGLISQAFFSRRDKMRLEVTSRIGGTGTRLLFSGPIARENLGKIWDRTGLLSSQYHSGNS